MESLRSYSLIYNEIWNTKRRWPYNMAFRQKKSGIKNGIIKKWNKIKLRTLVQVLHKIRNYEND